MSLIDQSSGQSATALDAAEPAFRGVGLDPEPRRQRIAAWLLRQGIVVALVVRGAVLLVAVRQVHDVVQRRAGARPGGRRGGGRGAGRAPVAERLHRLRGRLDRRPGRRVHGPVPRRRRREPGPRCADRRWPWALPSGRCRAGWRPSSRSRRSSSRSASTPRCAASCSSSATATSRTSTATRSARSAAPTSPAPASPCPVFIAAGVLLLGWTFHTRTKWGRHVVSIGVNPEAARRAGISLNKLPLLLYVVTGACAGIAAVIRASRLDSAPPTLGEGLEIDVLSAVLLGGVAFGGGKGSIVGVAAGVVFIGFLNNGLLLMGAPPFWLRVSSGPGPRRRRGARGDEPVPRTATTGSDELTIQPPSPSRPCQPPSTSPSARPGCRSRIVIETELRERILLGRIEPGGRINVRQLEQHLRRLAHPDPRGDPAARSRRARRQRPPARRRRGRRVAQRARRHLRPPADHRTTRRRDAPWQRCRAPTSTSSRPRTTRWTPPNGVPASVDFSTAHWDFHWHVLRPGSTDEIERLLHRLWRVADRYVRLTSGVAIDAAHDQHHQLYDACRHRTRRPPPTSWSATSTSPATRCAASSTSRDSNEHATQHPSPRSARPPATA